MIIKTNGIVLRTVKYSETSIIADIYTREKGLRSYIISGVRTQKAKVSAGLVQVMSLVEIVVYDREEKGLNRIKEIKAAYVYTSLPFDVLKSSVGIFIIEVVRRTIQESDANEELFDFLINVFMYLDKTKNSFANLHLCFLMQLSRHLGFKPNEEKNSPEAVFDLKEGVFTNQPVGHPYFLDKSLSSILRGVISTHWSESHLLMISREERKLLLSELLNFYRFHLDNFSEINSIKILQEIF